MHPHPGLFAKGLNLVNIHDETGEVAPADPISHHGPIDRVLDAIAWICMMLAGLALVVIVITFGWLVYGRYVLNDTPTWVEQLSLLLVSYITFLGAAVGVRRNSHLSIDFVREALPAVPREVMRYIADLLVVIFGAFMAWEGYGLVMGNLDRIIPMIDVAEAWRAVPLVICGVLMVVFAGYNIVTRIAHPMRGQE
jgi:TRAP-type C4-dicarboxylate transport system permease small subunit